MRVVGVIGKTLMAFGVLILLFVVFELWGTGLHEVKAQNQLTKSFDRTLASTTTTEPGPTTTLPGKIAPSVDIAPAIGDAIGRIEIPKIHVNKIFVQGISLTQLDRAPGHYPQTPFPGQAGNASIAGHRTTYGAPFFHVDQLKAGDKIIVTTAQGRFVYSVQRVFIVLPNDTWVLDTATDHPDTLTLTACHPKLDLTHRIIVRAVLDGKPAPRLPGEDAAARRQTSSTLADGLDPAARRTALPAAVLWGLVGAAVLLAAWLIAKLWRKRAQRDLRRQKFVPYIVALPVFLLVLFVFFENLSQVLPAGL